MKHVVVSALLACMMGAMLLSGCTSTITSTTSEATSDTAVQYNQEKVKVASPSESPVPESTVLPRIAPSTESQLEESKDQSLTELDEICQDGYLFYKQCQIGQEGLLDFDLNDQFFQGDDQYVALASIHSKDDFLTFCAKFYSDNFIHQKLIPWFDGDDACFVEQEGHLYYKLPSGTGLVIPLATSQAELLQQTPDEVEITFPLWDPQRQIALDAKVQFLLRKDSGTWKIDAIKEALN